MILERGYALPQDHFTIVPNAWIRDPRLSRRARGLLIELMTHRAGWQTSVAALAQSGPEGIAALTTAIKELIEAGYLVREWVRDQFGKRSGTKYIITEPAVAPTGQETPSSEPSSENHTMDDSPSFDLPSVAKPSVANPHTKKNNNYKKTKNQEEKRKKTPPPPPEKSHQPREADDEIETTRRQYLDELETKIRESGLSARFDKLTADDITMIERLIDVHGIPALVDGAKAMHNPADPARYAQAWIPAWNARPTPRISATAPSWTSCGECDTNGWIETDAGVTRCHCHPRSTGGQR